MPKGRVQNHINTSPTAVRSLLSQADINKIYWQTTNQQDFQGTQLKEVDKSDPYSEVHEVGHKTTKTWKFPERKAPLQDRLACTYSGDFGAKPLNDSADNRFFAEAYKGVTKSPSAPTLSMISSHRDFFRPGITVEEMRKSSFPPKNNKYDPTNTLNGIGIHYEKVSRSHAEHKGPNDTYPSLALSAKLSPMMMHTGQRPLEFWSSSYTRSGSSIASAARPAVDNTALGPWQWPPQAEKPHLSLCLPPSVDQR